MEEYVTANPRQVLLLGAEAVVQRPQFVANLVEQARLRVHAASAPAAIDDPGIWWSIWTVFPPRGEPANDTDVYRFDGKRPLGRAGKNVRPYFLSA